MRQVKSTKLTTAEVDRRWRDAIENYARELEAEWAHFDQIVSIVDEDMAGEVTEDDAGGLFASFNRLRRMGVRFDPRFIMRLEEQVPDSGRDGCESESFIEDGGQDDDLASDELSGPYQED